MLRVGIIDDEEQVVKLMVKKLESLFDTIEIAGIAHSVKEGIQLISNTKPDLIFLDINMPDGTGFKILENFPEPEFEVIFVTAYDQYAIKALKCSAVDYLLKPIDEPELKMAVEKAITNRNMKSDRKQLETLKAIIHEKQPGKLVLNTANGVEIVNVPEIIRVEADRRYADIILNDGSKITASKNLKDFEELLPQKFMRVHNSHIINLDYVRKLKTKVFKIVLVNGDEIEFSRRKKEEIIERIQQIH